MRVGVVGLLPDRPEEIEPRHARQLRLLGFSGASVLLPDPIGVKSESLVHARQTLESEGISVAQANAQYEMLVHPDEDLRKRGVFGLSRAVVGARLLGCDNAYVRPGSLNLAGAWHPHPDNTKPETFDRLVESLREVAKVAESEGVRLAVEGHVTSPLPTVGRMRDLFEAVGSSALGFNVDIVNFVGSIAQAYDTSPLIEETFRVLGPFVVCAHAKDLLVENRLVTHISECVIGEGLLDQAPFLRGFERACPKGFVLIEHLPADRVPAAKAGLDAALARAGLRWS